ncbi:MAG: site-2 protease family protein [Clostridia bacterium]|nr:site-2 protease family protein [Clostridia bacterium]
MLFDAFRVFTGDGNTIELIMKLLVRVFVIICVLPIHEFAHAFIADKLGDNTARLKGRLTLYPFAHVDPIGAVMTLLCGFGYAKAVPVNMRNFRKKKKNNVSDNIYMYGSDTVYDPGHAKRCMAAVAFAGPISNLIMAFISLILLNVVTLVSFYIGTELYLLMQILTLFFGFCASININLAVFNLLPIPPLDGSRIISVILPDKIYFNIMKYERIIMIVIMVLLFTGILTTPLSILSGWVYNALYFVATLPFKLITAI